jgi:hypothetical protein
LIRKDALLTNERLYRIAHQGYDTHSVSSAASHALLMTSALIPRREDAAKALLRAAAYLTLSNMTSKCSHIGHSYGEARRVPRLGIMLVTLISQPHLGQGRRVIACLVWIVGWVSGTGRQFPLQETRRPQLSGAGCVLTAGRPLPISDVEY